MVGKQYKSQKLKILISAKLTEDEYGVLGSALRNHAEMLHEGGVDPIEVERLYARLMGYKLTGHK